MLLQSWRKPSPLMDMVMRETHAAVAVMRPHIQRREIAASQERERIVAFLVKEASGDGRTQSYPPGSAAALLIAAEAIKRRSIRDE